MNQALIDLLTSKRLWAAVAAIIAILTKDRLGIDEEQMTMLLASIAAWIIGDSIRPAYVKRIERPAMEARARRIRID